MILEPQSTCSCRVIPNREVFPQTSGKLLEVIQGAANWPWAFVHETRMRTFAGLMFAAAVTLSGPAWAASDRANPIKMFDSDNDGTLDARCVAG
jgi:hypothetical protein